MLLPTSDRTSASCPGGHFDGKLQLPYRPRKNRSQGGTGFLPCL